MPTSFQLIKQAFRLVGENPSLFLKIIAIPALFSLFMAFFEPNQDTALISMYEWVVFIVVTLAMIAANVLMGIAMVFAVADRTLSVKQAYILALGKVLKYIVYSIVLAIISVIAFILFIIPGIIVTVWFSFGVFFLLLENLSIKNALKASRELVKGRWWKVAIKLLAFILFAIIVSIIFALISAFLSVLVPSAVNYFITTLMNLVFAPVAVAYMFLLYFNLKSNQNQVSTAPSYQ